jgi:hypothetical protein
MSILLPQTYANESFRFPTGYGSVARELPLAVDDVSLEGAGVCPGQFPKAHLEEVKIAEVPDAYAVATDLRRARRTDALLRGTGLVPPETSVIRRGRML